ncbi:hypothetical protein D6D19_09230 [Aureobasidium pullulans]|uniref:Uncharacterized protein n=1 Tax=Aureobasidium pullulans TaxID=5580 RepID=A0A4S9LIU0_AURPU|nr:hypothetical protein D6D19_09230 [Aureobasidium pullulans]THY28932.1 hypothetical protein D6D00_03928 [Aureobasidium pullulans]
MSSRAVFLAVLISFLVKCEASTNGNYSATNLTPRITSTTVAPGLGTYILAALGQTPTYTNTTTATAALNATSTSNGSSEVTSSSTRSTICYDNNPNKCWTDVYYTKPSIASTGVGAAYATSCSSVSSEYNSASNSWVNKHSYTSNYTDVIGGTSWIPVTYYANATTLCDGHARVNYSPAIATSSTTITTVGTAPSKSVGTASMGWMFPISSPVCSINPSDCDGLWKAYTTASSKWAVAANATHAVDAVFPTITPSPSMPPCINSSQSASNEAFSKSFYGCGLCTIFGNEVQLVYFPEPTTVSRDMCATTPSAKLTAYGKDDGTPYTGADLSASWNGFGIAPETAVVGTHTFTSGTAYISIKKVWALNRCSSHIGTTVSDAILALPSDRLLSLRYSQDHFQYFATTNKVTGYPFNFADLNSPVPYSAWNGQARCEFPGAADYKCNVIYEHDYNPQLAMPPGIRKLNPEWEGCQMWYGGLYDPPYALKPGTAVATPTVPFAKPPMTTSAAEASTVAPTTATATALADHTTERFTSTKEAEAETTQPAPTQGHNQDTQVAQSQTGGQNTQAAQNTQGGNQNNGGNNNNGNNNNNNNGQNTQAGQNTQGGNNGNGQNTQAGQTNQAGQNTQGQNQGGQNTQAQNSQGGQNGQEAQTQNGGQNTQGGPTQNGDHNTQAGQNQSGGQNTQARQTQSGAQNTQAGQSGQGAQTQNAGQGEHWNPTQAIGQNTQGGQNNQGANTANGAQNTQGSQAQGGSSAGNSQAPVKPQIYVFTAGTYTYTATKTNTVYVCGTDTVSVGGPAVTLPVDCVISAGTSGLIISTQAAAVTNRASAVTALPVFTKAVVVTVGTKVQTVSADSSGVVHIGSSKLTPGGSAATLDDGSVVSAESNGVKVGSTVVRYSTVAPAASAGPDVIVFIVGTKTVTASCPPGSTNQAVIGTVTITAGGAVQTLADGSRVSLASGGTIVVDGTSAAAIATPASAVVFTVNGTPVTAYRAADASSVATIDGTVVSRGGAPVTLSGGEVVSMGSDGLVVQQGSTTVPVSAFTTVSGSSDEDAETSAASGSGFGSGSGSGSDTTSNRGPISSTRTAQQNQGTQSSATATGTSGAASIFELSTKASLMTVALLISPLIFAIYL